MLFRSRDGKAEGAGALRQQLTVSQAHQLAGQRMARQLEAEFGADTGRLPGGQCDARQLRT